jgi:TRAP-type uncharacterized transport system fused permease subunit
MVAIGFLFTRMSLAERVLAFVAAICLLGEFHYSDAAGLVLAGASLAWQWIRRGRITVAAA